MSLQTAVAIFFEMFQSELTGHEKKIKKLLTKKE